MSNGGKDFYIIEAGVSNIFEYSNHSGQSLTTADPMREFAERVKFPECSCHQRRHLENACLRIDIYDASHMMATTK